MQTYYHHVVDSFLPMAFQKSVENYILQQRWYYSFSFDGNGEFFTPHQVGIDYIERNNRWITGTPRVGLASDQVHLKNDHPIIHQLWYFINKHFDDTLELTGAPEGMPVDQHPDSPVKQPVVPHLDPGWRVYANSRPSDRLSASYPIHKDVIDANDTTSRNILYNVNTEWYPSWAGEYVFYSDDEVTGDRQQWSSGQRRNFPTGWPCITVPHVPGAITCYDGRWLHSTRPTSHVASDRKISLVFRARLKQQLG